MVCSITINRKSSKESEVRYVDTEPIHYYYDEEEELDYEFLLKDLYEKVGELKRRIEILEAKK